MRLRTVRSLLVAVASAVSVALWAQTPAPWLSAPQQIAPGVEFYTSTDPSLADSAAGASAAYLLKLDPARVTLSSAHAKDEIMGLETANVIAARHKAIAAVNAGFFNTKTGDPASVLKMAGEFVSDATLPRGVVAIAPAPKGGQTLTFDQLSAKQQLQFTVAGKNFVVPIDSVDTTREREKLTLYTPAYHADTDTAPTGTEIVASGKPLTIRQVRVNAGHTPIPRDGVVLSFGGTDLPEPLAALRRGVKITIVTNWRSVNNLPPSVFESAHDIINGAGLLRRAGQTVTDRTAENLNPLTFLDVRHPRTLIGIDDRGSIWLIAIDGRQPGYAIGMDFKELQRLCDRLNLRDALNLDGGGSVTMVVKDKIVNKPSDAAGPRAISDVILVKARRDRP